MTTNKALLVMVGRLRATRVYLANGYAPLRLYQVWARILRAVFEHGIDWIRPVEQAKSGQARRGRTRRGGCWFVMSLWLTADGDAGTLGRCSADHS